MSAPATQAPAERRRRRSRTISPKAMRREIERAARAEGLCPECHVTPLRSDNTKGRCGYCQAGAPVPPPPPRPQCRADCVDGPRPCPFIGCKHHLYLDVNPSTGSIKFNFPGKELDEIGETCALDVADRGGVTLEEVGQIMNVTRERIRQMEARGLLRLKRVTDVPDLEQP